MKWISLYLVLINFENNPIKNINIKDLVNKESKLHYVRTKDIKQIDGMAVIYKSNGETYDNGCQVKIDNIGTNNINTKAITLDYTCKELIHILN